MRVSAIWLSNVSIFHAFNFFSHPFFFHAAVFFCLSFICLFNTHIWIFIFHTHHILISWLTSTFTIHFFYFAEMFVLWNEITWCIIEQIHYVFQLLHCFWVIFLYVFFFFSVLFIFDFVFNSVLVWKSFRVNEKHRCARCVVACLFCDSDSELIIGDGVNFYFYLFSLLFRYKYRRRSWKISRLIQDIES